MIDRMIVLFFVLTMKLLHHTATSTRTLRTAIDTNFAQLQQVALVDEDPLAEIPVTGSIAAEVPVQLQHDEGDEGDNDDDGNGDMSDALRSAMERALAAVQFAKAKRNVDSAAVVASIDDPIDDADVSDDVIDDADDDDDVENVVDDPLTRARRETAAIQREFSQLDDEINSREIQIARLRAEIDSLHARRRELAPTVFQFESTTGSWHS